MSYVRFKECEREELNLKPLFKLFLFLSIQEDINRRQSLVPTSFKERLKFYSAGKNYWIPLFKRVEDLSIYDMSKTIPIEEQIW